MFAYIVRRILLMFPTLIGITLLLFLMVRFAPGLTGGGAFGEGGARAGRENREEAIRHQQQELHIIDENGNPIPLYRQYGIWLWNACHLEFGDSVQTHEKVSDRVLTRLPVTIIMNVIETFIVYLIAIPGGLLAAVKRGKTFDNLWSVSTIALFSIPVILSGVLAIYFFTNSDHVKWFPASGLLAPDSDNFSRWQKICDYLWHLVLPVSVQCLGGFAYLSKMMRGSLLDNLQQDYVRTAKAKGVSPPRIVLRHVLRNSLLPMITIFAGVIPGLLGGSIIVETIFTIPGMGQLAVTATQSRDLPVLQAITFIGAVIAIICLLLQDICYAVVDPRVSYD